LGSSRGALRKPRRKVDASLSSVSHAIGARRSTAAGDGVPIIGTGVPIIGTGVPIIGTDVPIIRTGESITASRSPRSAAASAEDASTSGEQWGDLRGKSSRFICKASGLCCECRRRRRNEGWSLRHAVRAKVKSPVSASSCPEVQAERPAGSNERAEGATASAEDTPASAEDTPEREMPSSVRARKLGR